MTELLTAEQMQNLEKDAIDTGSVTGKGMMEKAGKGVVDALFAQWPELAETDEDVSGPPAADQTPEKVPRRALVLCGPGNNGGDGFVIARLLHKQGWQIDVFLSGDRAKLPPDAAANAALWAELGPTGAWEAEKIAAGPRPDVIIDAVFGTGLTRPLPAAVAQVLDGGFRQNWRNWVDIRKVAVDCPSGLNLDTGHIPFEGDVDDPGFDPSPKTLNISDLTVTFHSPKPGHYLAMGPSLCGQLKVVDIGLRGDALERAMLALPPDPERVRLVEPVFCGRRLPMWPRALTQKRIGGMHKYDHGHVFCFAGGVGRGGAARLAARAALRAGAGLVTVVCPPAALQENACRLDAVMLRARRSDQTLSDIADDRVSGFCLGPGMGVSAATSDLVLEVLARGESGQASREPAVVLDADALTSFAQDPDALFEATHARTILTPHEGEFGRLFPDLAQSARGQKSKIDVVREAAARAGCLVLLKGEDTVIAAPDGGASLHAASYDRAAPWLATAGAGDVLAGLIAGLAASGTSPDLFVMAEVAVWLHVECARQFGPGLIAEDLPEALPQVYRALQDQTGEGRGRA